MKGETVGVILRDPGGKLGKELKEARAKGTRLFMRGSKTCGDLSAPCTAGRDMNHRHKCELPRGHKGPHQAHFDERVITWSWSRHQTCSFG